MRYSSVGRLTNKTHGRHALLMGNALISSKLGKLSSSLGCGKTKLLDRQFHNVLWAFYTRSRNV